MARVFKKSPREQADEFDENVIKPLRQARDWCHARNVVHRDRVARGMEAVIDGVLRLAYDHAGVIARDEVR